jgi:hypothetical protein
LPERHRCVVPAEASHTATTYVVVPIDPCPAGIASGSAFGVVEQFRARLMLACITTKRSTTSSVSCQPAARVPTALERMISDPASPSPSTPPNPPHPPRATVPDPSPRLGAVRRWRSDSSSTATSPSPLFMSELDRGIDRAAHAPSRSPRRERIPRRRRTAALPPERRPAGPRWPGRCRRWRWWVNPVDRPGPWPAYLCRPRRTHEDEDRQRVFRWLTRGVPSAF